MSPALAGRFLTTEPPGKSVVCVSKAPSGCCTEVELWGGEREEWRLGCLLGGSCSCQEARVA